MIEPSRSAFGAGKDALAPPALQMRRMSGTRSGATVQVGTRSYLIRVLAAPRCTPKPHSGF